MLLPNPDQVQEKTVDLRLIDLDHSGGPAGPVSGDHHSGVDLQWRELCRLLKEPRDILNPQPVPSAPKLAQTRSPAGPDRQRSAK